MKKLILFLSLILISFSLFAQNENKGEEKMELLRLFPRIACIGSSLASGEIVSDDKKAPGILFGQLGENGAVDELPACVDKYEGSWLTHICRRINAQPKHYSRGGLNCRQWLEWFNYFMALDNTKYPLYFIYLGGNDFYGNFKIGTPKDDIKANTFSGNYCEIIRSIRKINPHAVILCMSMFTNWDNKNQNGNTQKDFSEAVKNITKEFDRCYYIDFAGTSPNTLEKSKHVYGGHYDSIGYLQVSYDIEKLANDVLWENRNDLRDVSLYF